MNYRTRAETFLAILREVDGIKFNPADAADIHCIPAMLRPMQIDDSIRHSVPLIGTNKHLQIIVTRLATRRFELITYCL